MCASASGHRALGKPRRALSDPGHPYVTPPYTVQWPAPMRQTTSSKALTASATPSPQSPSRTSSLEVTLGDSESVLAQERRSDSPGGSSASPPVSPRSPSPQRFARHGTIRAPQGHESLTKNVAPRTASNVPSAITAPHPNPATWGEGQGQGVPAQSQASLTPTSSQMAGLHRQGSHHTAYYYEPHASVHREAILPSSRHHSAHPRPSTTHHISRPRSRSRPPSAASHRYASNITPSVYGHGSSGTLNVSRTSLNGGVSSRANHRATTPPPASRHASTGSNYMSSGSHHRSRSRTRAPPSSTDGSTTTTYLVHKQFVEPPPRPAPPMPMPMPAANEIRRAPHWPSLPANYDGQIQTRYVNMLLALDDISPLFSILSSFFTWILLAGFVLFPGTFASWKDEPAGSAQSDILYVVNHVSLFAIAFICTGLGICGMCWLWWRWYANYVWLTNRIFLPGFLNSVAGVISTLAGIYGTQGGYFGITEKTTIIVTGTLSIIFGILVLIYELLIRNLKLEHDQEVGAESAGKHGEGVMGEKGDGLAEV